MRFTQSLLLARSYYESTSTPSMLSYVILCRTSTSTLLTKVSKNDFMLRTCTQIERMTGQGRHLWSVRLPEAVTSMYGWKSKCQLSGLRGWELRGCRMLEHPMFMITCQRSLTTRGHISAFLFLTFRILLVPQFSGEQSFQTFPRSDVFK